MALVTDPAGIAGLVTRELRAGEREGAPTRIAVARRVYATEQADLWNALTDPERLPRWFLPVSGELVEGGRYAIEGNASGTVESCDAPRAFALTWEAMGQVSWLEVRLAPAPGGAAVDPEAGATFGFTEEGRIFFRAAADGWTAAAIAAGEDPDAMRAAGDTSFGFYTTLPEGPSGA